MIRNVYGVLHHIFATPDRPGPRSMARHVALAPGDFGGHLTKSQEPALARLLPRLLLRIPSCGAPRSALDRQQPASYCSIPQSWLLFFFKGSRYTPATRCCWVHACLQTCQPVLHRRSRTCACCGPGSLPALYFLWDAMLAFVRSMMTCLHGLLAMSMARKACPHGWPKYFHCPPRNGSSATGPNPAANSMRARLLNVRFCIWMNVQPVASADVGEP